MIRNALFITALFAFLFSAGNLSADTIVLKDRTVYEGTVIEFGKDHLVMDVDGKNIEIPHENIANAYYADEPDDIFEEMNFDIKQTTPYSLPTKNEKLSSREEFAQTIIGLVKDDDIQSVLNYVKKENIDSITANNPDFIYRFRDELKDVSMPDSWLLSFTNIEDIARYDRETDTYVLEDYNYQFAVTPKFMLTLWGKTEIPPPPGPGQPTQPELQIRESMYETFPLVNLFIVQDERNWRIVLPTKEILKENE